jgi:hypothetical protein
MPLEQSIKTLSCCTYWADGFISVSTLGTRTYPELSGKNRGVICGRLVLPRLQAGWYGLRIPARTRDFSLLQNVRTGSGSHPASCSGGSGVLSRQYIIWGLKLTTYLHLLYRLRVSGAILVHLLPSWREEGQTLLYYWPSLTEQSRYNRHSIFVHHVSFAPN